MATTTAPIGSTARTNQLLSAASKTTGIAAPTFSDTVAGITSGGRDTLPAGVAYETYNPDGSVRSSQSFAQKSASDKAAIANGTDTAPGVGGELTGQQVSSAPIQPPPTPTNTPVNTSQPNPSTVNATPYTGTSQAADASSQSPTQQAHAIATASGTPAPQNAGVGVSAATAATQQASASQGYTSPAPVVQAYADATQKLTDDYNKAMSTQGQGESLVQQYQDFTKQLGIPELNTELMNMKKIIDGTEDDVRNEVTKAGGFATDSQVLAMTNARNKTMIQNYNTLLQTRSDAQQQVTTMVGLAAQDRTFLNQQIDRQLNFDQQQVTFQQKALENAQSSIQKSIDTYGAASVYKQALATGDPTAVSRINAVMSSGGAAFDLHQASLHPTLDQQVKEANIAQSYAAIRASDSTVAKNNADIAATQTAKVEAIKNSANTADTVLTAVNKAMKQVSPLSTGFIGGSTSAIPGGPSKNLQSTIATIKSNLAFTELAKMRAASPTGGALGQISDKEEELLSSTVANLDVGQSTSQLKSSLQQVQTHYVNYLTSLGYGYDAATGTVIAP